VVATFHLAQSGSAQVVPGSLGRSKRVQAERDVAGRVARGA
jgi:hypothetical protein